MNTSSTRGAGRERSLLDALGRTLAEIGWIPEVKTVSVDQRAPDAADAAIHLALANRRKAELRVHVKGELRPGSFPAWSEQRRARGAGRVVAVPVLAMPFVSTRLADLCRQAGWSWHDLAGNCW